MHLDHRQEGADGTKCSIGWCDTRHLLRKVEGFDGNIQRGENPIPPLWLSVFGIHGQWSK